jgi:hypothetical protein
LRAAKARKRQAAKKRQEIVLAATPLFGAGSLIRFDVAVDVPARTRTWRFLAPWRFSFPVSDDGRRLE